MFEDQVKHSHLKIFDFFTFDELWILIQNYLILDSLTSSLPGVQSIFQASITSSSLEVSWSNIFSSPRIVLNCYKLSSFSIKLFSSRTFKYSFKNLSSLNFLDLLICFYFQSYYSVNFYSLSQFYYQILLIFASWVNQSPKSPSQNICLEYS